MIYSELKGLRAKYGLTQEDVAKKLNISTVAYRQKENGHRDFMLKESKIISELFNKDIEEIFFTK